MNQIYQEKLGIEPFSLALEEKVKENRLALFKKFPEFENNMEKLDLIENYFNHEILDFEKFQSDREKKNLIK